MFVLMLNGHPITAKLPEDLGFGERFWYWHGASGQSFIHSIYPAESCPPLPGAVFIAVRHRDGKREPVLVGRFSQSWDGPALSRAAASGVNELHVHLLARGDSAAQSVLDDLQAALVMPCVLAACLSESRQGELVLS